MSLIPRNVIHGYSALLNWEDENNAQELSALTDPEEYGAIVCTLYISLRLNNPPIIITSNEWREFVLNVYLDYAQDFLGRNLRSVIKKADEDDIVAAHLDLDASDPGVENGNPQFMRAFARFNTTIGTD